MRSQKNVVSTWICCLDRYFGGSALITAVRYETALPRNMGSSSLIYSPSDCTTSISVVLLYSTSKINPLVSKYIDLGPQGNNTLSNPLSNLLSLYFIVVYNQHKRLQGRHCVNRLAPETRWGADRFPSSAIGTWRFLWLTPNHCPYR